MAKILLVEDDKSLREIYGVRLMAEGYEIVSAGDGEEALAMAIKERPDLIVSDVMMPKISGFDMLDILRSTTETKNVKVIMMTALSSEDQRARGESLGADRYLVKSQVGIEDVVRTVHDVLGDGIPAPAPAPVVSAAPVAAATVPAPAPVDDPVAAPVATDTTAPIDTSIAPAAVPAPAPVPPAPLEAPVFPEPVAEVSTPAFTAPVTSADPAYAATPAPAPAEVPAPVETPVFAAPAPAPVAPPNPFDTPVPAAPVFTAPPAPIAAPVPPVPAPAPVESSMPQPTAPFSTPAPASIGERVIAPLSDPSAAQASGILDISSQIEQALGTPATPPPTPGTPPTL